MLNKKIHRLEMINILLRLFKTTDAARVLGFKEGTAAYLFYNLPRFSVDLDFDLLESLDKKTRSELITKINRVLEKDYVIKNQLDKRFTLFWLLSYKKGDRRVKIEVSKRKSLSRFENKPFYGMNIPVMVLPDMATNKLMALVDRKKFASRDVFDAWYFLSLPEVVEINYDLVKQRLGLKPEQLYKKVLKRITKERGESLLLGMGELLSDEQKKWVKNSLVGELSQLVKMRLDAC